MSLSWVQWGLTALVLVLLAFVGYQVNHHRQVQPAQSVSSGSEEPTDAWIQGFRYRQTQSGITRWEVMAERAQVFEQQHRAHLQNVSVRLFGARNEEMLVKSDEGVIDTATKNFYLVNRDAPVSIAFADGFHVRSNRLQWVETARQLTTQDHVEIRGHGLTITGTGLIAELDAEQFTILRNVQAQIR
ncbi:MAG: LPS export ABC transporter periplasmic protein LptC [Nitrospirae bacterium]|nr:MAG: LPS export ABC transporter periplasmic protein LptC [Nitrospirota bacterium]